MVSFMAKSHNSNLYVILAENTKKDDLSKDLCKTKWYNPNLNCFVSYGNLPWRPYVFNNDKKSYGGL